MKLRRFVSIGTNPSMIVRRANVILSVDKNQDEPMKSKDAAKVFDIDPVAVTNQEGLH